MAKNNDLGFAPVTTQISTGICLVSSVLAVPLFSPLLITRCDIGVKLSIHSIVCLSVRPSKIHVKVLYSVAVIAGSMKPCIVITLDTLFKQVF